MPHKPKVTVWIPSYNHAPYLPAAIESILAQTYKDFEIVIVDDGSRDDSFAIARSYAAQYPNLISVYTHDGHVNRGISETVNLAFTKSRGDYVSGLPSDDLLKPRKLERQVAFLERNPHIGWVYGPVEFLHNSQRPELERVWGRDISREPDPLESLLRENLYGASVLMRRSCVEQVGSHDPSLVYSDWDFWLRMASIATPAFLEEPLVLWRIHDYNTSMAIDEVAVFRHTVEVMKALREKSPTFTGGLARPRIRALIDLYAAFYLYMLEQEDEAVQSLQAAFASDEKLQTASDYFVNWLRKLPATKSRTGEIGERRSRFAEWVSQNLPNRVSASLGRRVAAFSFRESALSNYYRDVPLARRMAIESVKRDPASLRDPQLRNVLLRSLAGQRLLGSLRRIKGNEPS